MSITIELSDELESALRAKAEALERPTKAFIEDLLKQYAAAPDTEDVAYSETDDALILEGLRAIDAGRLRPAQAAFAAFAARHNLSEANSR